jgi:hypothetical protein
MGLHFRNSLGSQFEQNNPLDYIVFQKYTFSRSKDLILKLFTVQWCFMNICCHVLPFSTEKFNYFCSWVLQIRLHYSCILFISVNKILCILYSFSISDHTSYVGMSKYFLLFQMISLLPARVIKLLEFIGFSGSKVSSTYW